MLGSPPRQEGPTSAPKSPGVKLKFPISEFDVSPLPESVKNKWSIASCLPKGEQRAAAIREARNAVYALHDRASPVRQRRSGLKLADMRNRAAAAAAAAAAAQLEQTDSERSALLAARMLANMQAAERRRLEAREAQRARLAAKSELVMTRLAESQAKETDKHLRQQRRKQLRTRLGVANNPEQAQLGNGSSGLTLATAPVDGQLKPLVTGHGLEDWMQDLSPHTAASAAAFRATRSSRRLQRSWRSFASQRKTTAELAQNFAALGVAGLDYGIADGSVPLLVAPPHALKPSQSPAPAVAPKTSCAGTTGGSSPPPSPGVVLIGGMSGGSSPHHARFEDFAAKLQSSDTLRAAQALLRRLEQRLAVRGAATDGAQSLLRQLSPSAPAGRKLDRYPVRVMLCAYMIKEHPEVVFNNAGGVEARLSAAAHQMLAAFEALLMRLLQPAGSTANISSSIANAVAATQATAAAIPCPSPLTKSMASYVREGRVGPRAAKTKGSRPAARQLFSTKVPNPEPAAASTGAAPNSSMLGNTGASPRPVCSSGSGGVSLASLLVAFDDSWLEYLDQFVVWKGHDAAALEVELMRMAVRLERSMRMKLGRREVGSPEVAANPDLQAMVNQVSHDHALLADRIARLTGAEGQERLAAALEHVRQQVAAELAAEEAAAAVAAEGSDAGWETASDSGMAPRPKSLVRASSHTSSLQDPLSDAQALAAAQQQSNQTAPEDALRQSADSDTLSNEQMVWNMLYTPDYALSTTEAETAWHRAMGKAADEPEPLDASDVESMSPEQLTAVVANRARIIAEKAFWDSLIWRFKTAVQGHALPSQLAPLLSELGTELSGFVSDPAQAQQLAEEYSEGAVLARLNSRTGQQGGGANLTSLGAMMEQLAQVLLQSGSADRAAEAAEATDKLRSRMSETLTAAAAPAAGGAGGSSAGSADAAGAAAPLAEALVAALRLLMTQLKLVKLDAANVKLAGLARAMKERGAVSYLQMKLSAAWQLSVAATDEMAGTTCNSKEDSPAMLSGPSVAERLPLTAAWVRQVQADTCPQLQTGLQAAGLLLHQEVAAAAVVAGGLRSMELRSGTRSNPSGPPPAPAAGGIKPVFPVAMDSWQGVVRAGLLALVTGDIPAVGPELPEILMFDRARLHEAQNSMQQLLVTAAGLLIVQQLRSAQGLPWDASLRAQARRRLLVVLSDPGMKLSHLVTELSQLAGGSRAAPERQVTSMFTTIVNPDATAFKTIRSVLACTLAAHLLYGGDAMAADGAAAAACSNQLARIGAAALSEDVAELGARLAGVAAVNEAVHCPLLQVLVGMEN